MSNFGKVVVILSIIPAISCCVERSFSVLQKLKTYLRSTRHPALLRIERSHSNIIGTEKVIDEFELRKGRSKFFFQAIFIYFESCEKKN